MNTKLKPGDRFEAFIPREPDWKQLYYAISLRVTAAYEKLQHGEAASATESITAAMQTITMNEAAIELGNSLVTVQTSKSEVA